MNNCINKEHWNEVGVNYNNSWESYGKKEMSKKETGFIIKYLKKINPTLLLDLGVGTGRILKTLSENTKTNSEIYGLDISSVMVAICKEKFKDNKKIKEIKIRDIANKDNFLKNKFDFITAIRVLKYNENWRLIIKKVYNHLNSGGIFVFTMPNSKSINRFFKGAISMHRTSTKELRKVSAGSGFEILEIRSFTKLPDFFYDISKNLLLAKCTLFVEKILELIFGKIFLGRVLFIAVKRNE